MYVGTIPKLLHSPFGMKARERIVLGCEIIGGGGEGGRLGLFVF